MPELRDCLVLHGPDLTPHRCARLAWLGDTLTAIELGPPEPQLTHGSLVIIPGLYNGHTHIGDSALPDGATGLTLEEAFFRPAGYKYRELARLTPEAHLPHLVAHHRYMAQSGTIAHLDFREQGPAGAELLRAASRESDVDAIILGQLDHSPFTEAELDANAQPLPDASRHELIALLAAADGFSESTINDLTDPTWRQVRAATQAAGKLRAIHCLENVTYRDTAQRRTGRGDLARALAQAARGDLQAARLGAGAHVSGHGVLEGADEVHRNQPRPGCWIGLRQRSDRIDDAGIVDDSGNTAAPGRGHLHG